MNNCISFSLFGHNKERHPECFDFESLLRGFLLNLRLSRLLFPGWVIHVSVDDESYEGYQKLWDCLTERKIIVIKILPSEPLTYAMMWRMLPVFDRGSGADVRARYDHVLCRDVDSPMTYRDRQCVEEWIAEDTAVHAMTDSISHTIPMMGGMVGFNPKYFYDRTSFTSFAQMVHFKPMEWERKGVDQEFMMRFIYRQFAKQGEASITQHYLLGIPNTFLPGFHNRVPDIDVKDVRPEYRHLTPAHICGHCGSGGWYSMTMENEIEKLKHLFEDLSEIEKQSIGTSYWGGDR